jgi:DNA-binding transcriptional MerR regulator
MLEVLWMPRIVNGQMFYRTSEACAMAGISRMTFLRWVRLGLFADVEYRDWRGWRLFTDDDLARLRARVDQIQKIELPDNQVRLPE